MCQREFEGLKIGGENRETSEKLSLAVRYYNGGAHAPTTSKGNKRNNKVRMNDGRMKGEARAAVPFSFPDAEIESLWYTKLGKLIRRALERVLKLFGGKQRKVGQYLPGYTVYQEVVGGYIRDYNSLGVKLEVTIASEGCVEQYLFYAL